MAKQPKPDQAEIHGRAKDLMSELKDLVVRRDTLQAQCDTKIKPIQNEFDKKIVPLNEQIAIKEQALEKLCAAHRSLLFAEGTKSLEVPFGSFGFKDTPPALGLLEGHTEDGVIANVKRLAKKFADSWIKTKETLVKATVKKDVDDGKIKPELLEKLGLEVKAGEKFWYKVGKQKLG